MDKLEKFIKEKFEEEARKIKEEIDHDTIAPLSESDKERFFRKIKKNVEN